MKDRSKNPKKIKEMLDDGVVSWMNASISLEGKKCI